MEQEDALLAIANWIRAGGSPKTESTYGYDIYIPNVIRSYLRPQNLDENEKYREIDRLYPVFVDAAWDLCRQGILRPGVKERDGQATDDGSAGAGYSITVRGRKWLSEETDDFLLTTDPDRFSQMLEPLTERFGEGFIGRANEAVRCYGSHAYLACCAMCGAAAESILLAAAIEKTQDEETVLKDYASAGGRNRVEKTIIGQAPSRLKNEFSNLSFLLKYWRDESSHGLRSSIQDTEAHTALLLLLRFAKCVDDNWDELTGRNK